MTQMITRYGRAVAIITVAMLFVATILTDLLRLVASAGSPPRPKNLCRSGYVSRSRKASAPMRSSSRRTSVFPRLRVRNPPAPWNQVGKLLPSRKFRLRPGTFIWYKQFTESSVWLAGQFCCNSRRRPASKDV